ncbi:MAG: hypothetical protein L6427_02735 [Actinomycetia bacterium]|nr:hypothetical protein [Actinomycetes bacterium]
MRKWFLVLVVLLLVAGCGGVAVYTVGGREYTPEEYRTELETLYEEYQEASKAYSEGSEMDMEAYERVSEASENLGELGFQPNYDPTGTAFGAQEDIIEEILEFNDEQLGNWMKSIIVY